MSRLIGIKKYLLNYYTILFFFAIFLRVFFHLFSPIEFAKLKIKRQSARKGLDFRHPGETMCEVWGLGTVDLVSTKNRKFRDEFGMLWG